MLMSISVKEYDSFFYIFSESYFLLGNTKYYNVSIAVF